MRVYLQRWRQLGRPARLYLVHAALLTGSLAIIGLYFNLLIVALGYGLEFLGLLNTISLAVAALLSLPLWWLVSRVGFRQALLWSAALQALGALLAALWPSAPMLVVAVSLTGAAAVLFQVSSPPFMMEQSDAGMRAYLFSANAATNIALAGVGSLLAGGLSLVWQRVFGVDASTALVYRASFVVAACGLVLSLVPLLMIRTTSHAKQNHVTEPAAANPQDQNQGWVASRFDALVRRAPASWQTLIRKPVPLLQLLVPPFLISWGAALLFPYLNLFFPERFAVTDAGLGLIFATLGVVTGGASLLGPALSERFGKIGTVWITQALSIPFLLLLGFVPLLGVAVGAALARAALFNMGSPLYDAFAMEQTSEAVRPVVIGLINGAYSVGYLGAPLISAHLRAKYGWEPVFLLTTLCYSLAVLSNYLFFARRPALANE